MSSTRSTDQRPPQSAPAGYRWIAVRPGAAPPPRRSRRPLGPTPRYAETPRWGLVDEFDHNQAGGAEPRQTATRSGPSTALVRRFLVATMAILGLAALVHISAYVLLLINRTMLLKPWLAALATWSGVAVSVLALFAVIASAVVLTNWLIARRARAFARHGGEDHRSPLQLRAGCLVPVLNLFWAPVFVIELAQIEGRLTRLRQDVVVWWCVWILSTIVCAFSIATSFTSDPQRIADNTVTTSVAYLLGLAAVLLAARVYDGFERTPVDRPVKRWVMVPSETSEDTPRESPVPVGSGQREPAA